MQSYRFIYRGNLEMQGYKLNSTVLFAVLIIAAIGVSTFLPVKAQNFIPQDIRFDSYTINDGLSESEVNAIVEDKYGEICIATQKGMDIFNGYDFENITSTDSGQTQDLSIVQHISAMPGGLLLISTQDSRTYIFNPTDRSFIATDSLLHDAGFNGLTSLYCSLKTSDHEMWFGTNDGILIESYGRDLLPGIPYLSHYSTSNSSGVYSLNEDKDGRIWALTDQNILILDTISRKILYKISPASFGLENRSDYFVLYTDRNKNIWIYTSHGLYSFQGIIHQHPVFKKIQLTLDGKNFSDTEITCLLMDETGILWIGTADQGLILYNENTGKIVDRFSQNPFYSNTLNSNSVLCLTEDNHHRIWVGTINGINKYDLYLQKFALYSQDRSDPKKRLATVFSIIGIDSLHLMVVSNNMPVIINTATGIFKDVRISPSSGKEPVCYMLSKDASEKIWVSTRSGLWNIKKAGTQYFIQRPDVYKLKPLDRIFLSAMLPLGDSLFWIGSDNGLYLWNRSIHTLTHFTHSDSLFNSPASMNYVESIVKDKYGNLWFGTNNGISRFDPGTEQFHNFLTASAKTPEAAINVLNLFPEGDTLWIATLNDGLIQFNINTHSYQQYTTGDGLPDNTVWACMADNQHHIWLSTNKGISEFFPEKNEFRNFTREDGLQSNEFDESSIYKNKKGEIFFGGIYGINKINPDEIISDTLSVPVMVSQMDVYSGKSVKSIFPGDQRSFSFSYRDNTLFFRFEALNFIESKLNHYRVRFENVGEVNNDQPKDKSIFNFLSLKDFMDQTWMDIGNRNTIIFSNLAPGKYALLLEAMNEDGEWNKNSYSLFITIRPPFWDTTWFKVLIILCVLVLLLGIFRWRFRIIKKKHLEKIEKAKMQQKITQLEKMALQAQMNPHFIFNSLNSIKSYILSSEPDEAVEYLNDFASLIRNILHNSKNEKISIEEELEAIAKYVKLEERRLKKKVTLVVKPNNDLCLSNMYIPPLILQPFIENAIWHGIRPKAGEGVIEILINEENNLLIVCITDNGIGREQAAKYRNGSFKVQSLGVSITQERLSHFNGGKIKNIAYEDIPDQGGTKVTLWINPEDAS